jgi:hypothetical protein
LPTRVRALKSSVMWWHPTEGRHDPTHLRERFRLWLAEWILVTLVNDMQPPRDPNDGDEDEEDGKNEEEEEEPAVIREPDE